jgi:hypothetical protein
LRSAGVTLPLDKILHNTLLLTILCEDFLDIVFDFLVDVGSGRRERNGVQVRIIYFFEYRRRHVASDVAAAWNGRVSSGVVVVVTCTLAANGVKMALIASTNAPIVPPSRRIMSWCRNAVCVWVAMDQAAVVNAPRQVKLVKGGRRGLQSGVDSFFLPSLHAHMGILNLNITYSTKRRLHACLGTFDTFFLPYYRKEY